MDNRPMKNIPEFYILERPIETPIGILHPIKVEEQPELLEYMGIIMLDKSDILIWLKNIVKQDSSVSAILEIAQELTLFEFICLFKDEDYKCTILYDLYSLHKKLFKFCFRDDVFDKIQTSEEYEYYMDLIQRFNSIEYKKPNPNPNIERRNQIKRMLEKAKGESIDFESMVTSVEVMTGKNANKMTLYKFRKIFDRVAQFKSYDTTVLFSMFSSEVKIEPWYKIIEKKQENPSFITEEQLQKARKQSGLQEKL